VFPTADPAQARKLPCIYSSLFGAACEDRSARKGKNIRKSFINVLSGRKDNK